MKLLTAEICDKMPMTQAHASSEPKDIPIVAKFFCPWSNWTWFAYEAEAVLTSGESVPLKDPRVRNGGWDNPAVVEDVIFFGYVVGFEREIGTFSLRELQSVKKLSLGIERDLHLGKVTLQMLMDGANP